MKFQHEICPERAQELFSLTVQDASLPQGDYWLLEAYCTNPACKCEQGVIEFARQLTDKELTSLKGSPPPITASLIYSWKKPLSQTNPSVSPERETPWSQPARRVLREFLESNPNYSKKLQEHYHQVREAAAQGAIPQIPIKNEDRIQRNDPCPCGSGKKFKKCCLHDGS